ncbi:response regulator [Nocardioides conyzicola]|uniref:Response regulatory domain-containing protein n=1 Tax=Nocardioides conyzicola TaxID=1651781 RepID=A0ABP8XQL5_9ACTN
MPTDLVIVDDPTLFAESLRTALSLAGHSVDWLPADEATRAGMPWVVGDRAAPSAAVLDLDLTHRRSALDLLEQLVGQGVRVAVLTASDDHLEWARCLELGAIGVVQKTLPLSDVVAAVSRLAAGEPVMTETQRSELQREVDDRARRERELEARFALLSPDEAWVLGRLMAGELVHDIARTPPVRSPGVVHGLVNSALHKLQVASWLGAVNLAHEYGWSPPSKRTDTTRGGQSSSSPEAASSLHSI